MKQEKKLLEVGDVVYRQNSMYQKLFKTQIDRVTPKQAYIGSTKFRREYVVGDNGSLDEIGRGSYSKNRYYLPNPRLDKKFNSQNLKEETRKLLESNFNSLTPPQLLSIKKTLTLPDEDLAIWIKVEDLDKDNLPLGDFLGFEDGGDIVVGRLYKITNVDSDSKKTYDIALEYNEGDNAIYPTQVIPIMSLLHLPTKPSTK